ncbi:hypothetical protein D3C75_1112730 [compost metagenome]
MVCQFDACVQVLLALLGLGVAELREQLPKQQTQQQQSQQGQRTFDRAAHRSGWGRRDSARRGRMIEIGQTLVLLLGWRRQGLICTVYAGAWATAPRLRTIRPYTRNGLACLSLWQSASPAIGCRWSR